MNTYLEVISTEAAELGALVPVDEYSRPVDLECDGIRTERIDISDLYSEDEQEWDRLVEARIEEYGLTVTRADKRTEIGFEPRWKLA